MSLYQATQVIQLYQQATTPLSYAFIQGTYTRDWQRYFSSSPIAYGTTRINGVDNGPGINQYTFSILVTNWPTTSLPYLQGVTQTWDVQKFNLQAAFQVTASPLVFYDPFGQPPTLTPQQTGVYFWKFTETLLPQSTPELPFIQYEITLTESPPGITV